MQLQGKTVVVTGGGRGIGREIAKGFAARGAHVALFDLRQEDLDESMRQCVAAGAAPVNERGESSDFRAAFLHLLGEVGRASCRERVYVLV